MAKLIILAAFFCPFVCDHEVFRVLTFSIKDLFSKVDACWGAQRGQFVRRLNGVKRINNEAKAQQVLTQIAAQMEKSIAKRQARFDAVPAIEYPEALPVSQKKDEIAKAISEHQVVIIAGETGSGKTTQIPKICLELGLGVDKLIGHTQPRRIAARSVADRIADELKTPLGQAVGYKIRFNDNVSDSSYIKLMTDGILLAEVVNDRQLSQYDTIIIDEAHERSLNIDFLLGYLKQLLPKRPDLKVIITSATIDPERFSKHFGDAPIIEVSGRTFPVEVLYRPINEDQEQDKDQIDAIIGAVEELETLDKGGKAGDILIFMNGEREIRDTADALEKRKFRHTSILPLYARLSASEQNRVFQSSNTRRIVLATNVAETSLTIPGIKYVIDPGTARISRYSYRTKVQRLPIEAVSQASANQRKGRCGRVSEGVCIRLYSEEDFNNRPEFTDPEILRTNLASVILQMMSLKLGSIEQFPFVQAPDSRNINDGLRLLEEIGALKAQHGKKINLHAQLQLSERGKQISRLPIDPRLGRMVVHAAATGCLHEVMVITAALSIQDPRERPNDARQKADEAHQRFVDNDSDFITFLHLWDYIKEQQQALSNSQFRKQCRKDFLAYMRIREWQDIYAQMQQVVNDLGFSINDNVPDFESIHIALATGLLSHVGFKDQNTEYLGARNSRFFLFPASGLYKKSPKWIMAAELVETSRLFGRIAAKIQPHWLEPISQHLVSRSYSEPHWEKKRGAVMAFERQALYGLTIVPKRAVAYQDIDRQACRELFIRDGIVGQQMFIKDAKLRGFFAHNQALVDDIELLESKSRRRDILLDEQDMARLYDERIPEHITSTAAFIKWWRVESKKQPQLLNFTREDFMQHEAHHVSANQFPDVWRQDDLILPLEYHFEPGGDVDGVAVVIPVALLNQVHNVGFDWLVPGLLHELVVALIRSLPKSLRRNFVPAPQYADAVLASFEPGKGPLLEQISKQLLRMTAVRVEEDDWSFESLPKHLSFAFKVVDDKGKVLGQGYDLDELKAALQGKVKSTLVKVAEKGIEQQDITDWDFGDLPESYSKKTGQYEIKAYPALVAKGSNVAIELVDNDIEALEKSRVGVRKLILLNVPSPLSYVQKNLPNKAKLGLYYNPFGKVADLINDCINCAVDNLLAKVPMVRNRDDYLAQRDRVREGLNDEVVAIATVVEQILGLAHQLNKRMKGKVDLQWVQAYADIKEQLENLVFRGFVTAIGFERLPNLLRYIKAIDKRLEKLVIDPNRDRLNLMELTKAGEAHKALIAGVAKSRLSMEQRKKYDDIRWMIEEFRGSLFAQNLGTPYPISAKRIYQAIREYEALT